MRTVIDRAQITAIIAAAFGGDMNYLQYQVEDGILVGAIVDHKYSVDGTLPDSSDWKD